MDMFNVLSGVRALAWSGAAVAGSERIGHFPLQFKRPQFVQATGHNVSPRNLRYHE